MDNTYYDTVSQLEKMPADREYVLGWMGGYLGNPMREEQRVTEAYEAGRTDGGNGNTDSAQKWVK
ncbi:MAG: hypothetical protein DRR19_28390 [Candidatus Parabeggiatoa sp. nov. 1]|nr:MAG: hypothetical protein DRR19_28390 [Gammaproteobacteria bacterium]